MIAKNSLGKKDRLKSRKIIDAVFQKGRHFHSFPLRVQFLITDLPLGILQAAFSTSSKQFKKAVHRNRIKRVMREAYRTQKLSLYNTLQEQKIQLAVFFIYTGKELPDFNEMHSKMESALQRLIKELNRH